MDEIRTNKQIFPINSVDDNAAIIEYERVKPDILQNLKVCGAFSLTLCKRGRSPEDAVPTIYIFCDYPDKFIKVPTEFPYYISEGGPYRG